ncbi:myocardin isoform 2-T2 [Thomomys bottae]
MTLLGSEHSLLIRSKFRSVLQLRLQQRRTQEQLANQGFIPPLKSPTEFRELRTKSDSDKTEDFLKRKGKNRPDRAHLLNMHILHASAAERSIPTTAQMKLKRARLSDDLNEKIALRPGPLELVEKNILPVDSTVKQAIKGKQVSFSKATDAFAFEEDSSSDGLSPVHTRNEDPQSAAGSPQDAKATEAPLAGPVGTIQDHALGSENDKNDSTSQPSNQSDLGKHGLNTSIPVHAAVKSKTLGDNKNRHKKPKDPKPKVKKLKYHQYIPPDQKAEKSPPPMDSAYARLLQQQQLFLQLQILSQQQQQQQQQQQHRFSYPGIHQAQLKEPNEQMARNPNSSSTPLNNTPLSPVKNSFSGQTGVSSLKPGPLPPNLDDLKVSELRQQLRIRGLPVSGTKTALMDRLRPFQDCSGNPVPNFGDITTVTFPVTPNALPSYQSPASTSALSNGFYHFGSTSSSPPISPASSDLSVAGSLPDTFQDASPSFGLHPSPAHVCTEESLLSSLNGGSAPSELDGLDSEKDKMLVEKQKVINELTWKLQQEQRQVEELRMQLQKQKGHHGADEKALPFLAVPIKQEDTVSSCPFAVQQMPKGQGSSAEGQAQAAGDAAKAHGAESSSQSNNALSSTFLSPQCSPQHSPLGAVKSPQHISLPPSPNSQYFLTGVQGEGRGVSSPACSGQVCPAQNSGVHDASSPSFSPSSSSLHPSFSVAQTDSSHGAGSNPCPKSPGVQPKMACLHSADNIGKKFSVPSPTFSKSSPAVPDITQPPSYEDAVKQQMTRSQQMDELLDVLIESGEMPADAREDHLCLQKVPKISRSSRNPTTILPKPSASFSQSSSGGNGQVSFDHYPTDSEEHLEVLLNSHSPVGKVSNVALLKIGSEEPAFDGIMDGFSGKSAEELFNAHDILPGPLSPMHTQFSPSSMDSNGLQLSFTEAPWETMEWLDLTPPGSTPGFSSLATSGPSIFNIDFLDVTDLNLNSPMDLHLQQW